MAPEREIKELSQCPKPCPEAIPAMEEALRPHDSVLILKVNGETEVKSRLDFLPPEGFLIHYNIASANNKPHIEPLPNARATTSTTTLCMVDGQKQYVLEMEAAVIGVLEDGKMKPRYIGTLADFGDRTPRVEKTGRTYKTWVKDISQGGSSGMSTTWAEVSDWDEVTATELEYWVLDDSGEPILHTPNAPADSLKLWGNRLGEWVGSYPPEKLAKLGIVEGEPFLLSTGQILYQDDGARSIDPAENPSFTAHAVMKLGDHRVIETTLAGHTVPPSETTFSPTHPPYSWYD